MALAGSSSVEKVQIQVQIDRLALGKTGLRCLCHGAVRKRTVVRLNAIVASVGTGSTGAPNPLVT